MSSAPLPCLNARRWLPASRPMSGCRCAGWQNGCRTPCARGSAARCRRRCRRRCGRPNAVPRARPRPVAGGVAERPCPRLRRLRRRLRGEGHIGRAAADHHAAAARDLAVAEEEAETARHPRGGGAEGLCPRQPQRGGWTTPEPAISPCGLLWPRPLRPCWRRRQQRPCLRPSLGLVAQRYAGPVAAKLAACGGAAGGCCYRRGAGTCCSAATIAMWRAGIFAAPARAQLRGGADCPRLCRQPRLVPAQ